MTQQDAPAYGESIRLFLVAGRPDGLITAELINWTGHTLVGGIDDLPAMLARPEAVRPGVYFLLGDDGETPQSDPTGAAIHRTRGLRTCADPGERMARLRDHLMAKPELTRLVPAECLSEVGLSLRLDNDLGGHGWPVIRRRTSSHGAPTEVPLSRASSRLSISSRCQS